MAEGNLGWGRRRRPGKAVTSARSGRPGPGRWRLARSVVAGAALVLGALGGTAAFATAAGASGPTQLTLYVRTGAPRTTCTQTSPCGQILTAVTVAEVTGTGDAVTIHVGANEPSRSYDAVNIQVQASDLYSLTIEGAGTGTSTPSTKVTGIATAAEDFDVTSGSVIIEDLAIDGGRSTTTLGGGVYNAGGTLTLTHVTFATDQATTGGGVYNFAGAVTLTDVTFDDVTARDAGGAVFNAGGANVAMNDVTFEGDSAKYGGGLMNDQGTATLSHARFLGENVDGIQSGGGVYDTTATTHITDATFSTEDATTEGGGIYDDDSTVTLTDVTFSNDSATTGGGVYEKNQSTITLTDVTFSKDSATTGGGIYNIGSVAGVTNATFWKNLASGRGGGVYNTDGVVTIVDATFLTDTSMGVGGGVASPPSEYSYVPVVASIFDASSCFGDVPSLNDVVTTTSGCPTTTGVETTTTAIDLASTLALTTHSPTAPATLALRPTSPAIDSAPATVCETVSTDERGAPRPGDSPGADHAATCDAGAYELQHTIVTLTQGAPKTGRVTPATSGSFQLAVTNQSATSGKLTYTVTRTSVTGTSTPDAGISVASTGTVSVAATTAAGTYTLSGTVADPLHDSGAWAFTLAVESPTSLPGAPAAPTPPSGATSHASCSVSSGTCHASNDGVTVTASSGPGALTVSGYSSNPEGTPSFSSTGEYFDVETSSTSAFSTVTVRDCNLNGGTKLYWWDPTTKAWEGVSPVTGPAGTPPCLTATLSSTSTPTAAQLRGTVFAAGTAPPIATRVAGKTADATAAAELTRAFDDAKGDCPGSHDAVLATTKTYQDALSSQLFAEELTTGTLLTPTTHLSTVTASALEEEGIKTVYVVGGPLAVSTAVVTAVENLPADACGGTNPTGKITVDRVDGTTQYGTAAAVAEHVGTAASKAFPRAYAGTNAAGGTGAFNTTAGLGTGSPESSVPTAILASGVEFQDAQAASVVSYRTKLPLLLTPPTALSATAVSAIEKLGVRQVVLVGGTLAITNTVEASLVAKTGVSVLRVAGQDYTGTAAELARFEAAGATTGLGWTPGHRIMVARGNGFTDGLAGAVLENAHNTTTGPPGTARPLLLTETPTTAGTFLTTFLKVTGHTGIDKTASKAITSLTVLGGTLAVSTGVVTSLETDLSH